MVRKCHVYTFALATMMVAGGALAADKATRPLVGSANEAVAIQQPTNLKAPLSLRKTNTVTNVVNSNTFAAVSTCSCPGWDNGAFANDQDSDGAASHLGGAFPDGVQSADDFFLCEGNVYNLKSITVTLLTDSNVGATTKAKLELYADCNGCPYGSPLYTFTEFSKQDNGVPYMMNPSLRLVTYTFKIESANKDPNNRSIWLHGGIYWVSAIGLTDGLGCTMQMYDSTYWGSTGPGVKGSIPKKRFGNPGPACDNQYDFTNVKWTPVDDCCFGCKDLNFVVCAYDCKILLNNGVANRSSPAGSPSQFAQGNIAANSRSADDFVVPPCSRFCVCYLEGCVFTNCDPKVFKGEAEIYGNSCMVNDGPRPAYTFDSPTTLCHSEATKVVDLMFALVLPVAPGSPITKSYEAYRLEFHSWVDCCLDGGATYWVSIGVKYTFSSNEKAFFCCNDDCDRNCHRRFNRGQFLAPGALPVAPSMTPWVDAPCDFSFLIAGHLETQVATNSTPSFAADYNKDGKATVQDLFDFLAVWFAGCQ